MSSKMLAGLIAGGFGVALEVALILSTRYSSLLTLCLIVTLLVGLGVLAGALSAAWLDLADYGQQSSAGAFSGLVAAGVTELCDIVLRLVFAAIKKPDPTNLISDLIISRLPAETIVAFILLLVVVNLLLYLIYLLVIVGISGLTAGIVGQAKSAQALHAFLVAQEEAVQPSVQDAPDEALMDPALWVYQRPEYSPFIPDTPPPPLSPWQRRRLEREGALSNQQAEPPATLPGAGAPVRRVPPGAPMVNGRAAPGGAGESKPLYRLNLPALGQHPKPRRERRTNG